MVDCCSHEGPDSGDARFDIETDDGVIIVDTHSKPSAARAIIERLRDLTTKPVRYVINTHFHWDHWHGNGAYPAAYPAAYPGAEIVTNQITREAMLRKASSASRITSGRSPVKSPG